MTTLRRQRRLRRADTRRYLAPQGVSQARHRNLGHQRIHKALDDQPGRLYPREAAAHQVEELLLVHLADSRAMLAADDIVGADLQIRDRVGARGAAEQQVAVLLVGGCAFTLWRHTDQPREDGARLIGDDALEE